MSISKALGILDNGIDAVVDKQFASIGLLYHDATISKEETLKRNSEFVKCPKCKVVGNRPNMMRWHFENCKTEFKICLQCGNIIPRQGIKDFLYKVKKYCNRKCYMASKIGKPPIVMTTEIKAKISSRVVSDETKKKISIARSQMVGVKRGQYKKKSKCLTVST